MNDWLRTGLAYHEYAHVLQFNNPEQTETAVESFGGDWETMADCYALTFLPGLMPGGGSLFELGDDFSGNLCVKILGQISLLGWLYGQFGQKK